MSQENVEIVRRLLRGHAEAGLIRGWSLERDIDHRAERSASDDPGPFRGTNAIRRMAHQRLDRRLRRVLVRGIELIDAGEETAAAFERFGRHTRPSERRRNDRHPGVSSTIREPESRPVPRVRDPRRSARSSRAAGVVPPSVHVCRVVGPPRKLSLVRPFQDLDGMGVKRFWGPQGQLGSGSQRLPPLSGNRC